MASSHRWIKLDRQSQLCLDKLHFMVSTTGTYSNTPTADSPSPSAPAKDWENGSHFIYLRKLRALSSVPSNRKRRKQKSQNRNSYVYLYLKKKSHDHVLVPLQHPMCPPKPPNKSKRGFSLSVGTELQSRKQASNPPQTP